ncbi:hypothetical protein BGZ76_005167 [Entomortierella beljakovae]|nr:hypothetical protein BGZ76_005167 [Entomortierella beljakovae]
MFPKNVIAISKHLGTSASEIITFLTSKGSTTTLLEYPAGSYTGMRTFEKIGIMDFSGHTARLSHSLQQIKFKSLSSTANPNSNDKEEDEDAARGLAPFRNKDVMKKETAELVRAGLKFYYNQIKKDHNDGELEAPIVAGETKIIVLCTWDPVAKEPKLIAHFEPLGAPKKPRCKVEVHGAPRATATAKDSQWVRDRRVLESLLSKDSNEALLMNNETQEIYEGLSSNFFVFDRERKAILTAPQGSVLLGTVQKVVTNVCNAEKIPIIYEFPNLKRIDEWEGAFISSKSFAE